MNSPVFLFRYNQHLSNILTGKAADEVAGESGIENIIAHVKINSVGSEIVVCKIKNIINKLTVFFGQLKIVIEFRRNLRAEVVVNNNLSHLFRRENLTGKIRKIAGMSG